MMKMNWFVLVVAATLCGSADAGLLGVATLKGNPPAVPFGTPEQALGSPWVSYAIDLQTSAGELIAAVDVEITGPLHQRWTYDVDLEAYVQSPNSPNQTSGDSHLRAPATALFAVAAVEDNSGTGSPLSDTAALDYGVGSYLRGVWGIPNATTSASIAYLVVPKNQIPQIQIKISAADPGGNILGTVGTSAFDLPNVPEPNTAALLGLGLLACNVTARRQGRTVR